MEISLKGKRVFISGAAEGIGRATALSMNKLGAEVIICDIDEEKLSSIGDKVDKVEGKVDKVEGSVKKVNDSLTKLKSQVDDIPLPAATEN